MRRKKRSGWKHPLDINRNRRRCEKRRRSASAVARHAVEMMREWEVQLEVIEGRYHYQRPQRRDNAGRSGPERGPARRHETSRAWA